MLNLTDMQAYQAQTNLLYHALYFAPTAEFVQMLQQAHLSDSWPMAGEVLTREQGLSHLVKALAQPQALMLAKQDHTPLFIGPGDLGVIPWGSPYLHEKRLLCGPSTQALGRFYEHHGIDISTDNNEPVDHIGLMLSAVSALLALEMQQQDGHALAAVKVLLEEHLLPWSGRFLELLAQAANSDYYRGVGLLTQSVLIGLQHDLKLTPLKLQLFQ
ncbi:TorD/DmsD family molecular chaperone [Ferrimonas senticii]|uniref:TorD/DmsD family molecular chaperone n=1 Tax=Ferrimonas senticii TaxID=394566 RepID=UPI000416A4B8|nr:molecular chaperone TorD family protein [Ferrimonas senticii]